MTPRETTFSKEAVFDAAVAIVRESGLEKLTARAIAGKLKASVAPVYSTFGSMEALQREVLKEARRILLEKTTRAYTEGTFLNIGVGMVVFARDEAGLFRALFHTRHHERDILDGIFASILERMRTDPMVGQLSDSSRQRLLDYLGTYTLGLAAAVVYGQLENPADEVIIRHLMDVGGMMILGEVTGTADSASPESEETWKRVLKEKNIILPPDKEKP